MHCNVQQLSKLNGWLQAEDVANPAAHPGEGNAGGSQARSAARPEQSPGAAAASNAEGNAISPTEV